MLSRKVFILFLSLLFCSAAVRAEDALKSELHKRAEAADAGKNIASARSLYIHAFNDYYSRGLVKKGVECAVHATALYYKESFWKEAFDLLRHADETVSGSQLSAAEKAEAHYLVSKERLKMYIKLRKMERARDQLNIMVNQVAQAGSETLNNDFLYNRVIYYYTFGMNAKGNAVFKEMVEKLTASKEYGKVDEVYKTLIANSRSSGNANMVAQSYSNYIAWKDSTSALKHADEIAALKKQIKDNEAVIADQDGSLTTRQVIIVSLIILAGVLAAALVLGGVVLMRFIMLTRKQQNTIRQANENNALKAKFISNISAQLEPTLRKLDNRQPEVKALLDFSAHIQTLSELENNGQDVVLEDTQVTPFCEGLMEQIRGKVKSGVILTVNAPKMSASINREYVSHILLHLLSNAALYTPEGGKITLEFKKRGQHSHQFLVTDNGTGIPEEKREAVFKPFLEIRDLTKGDGLGLPICKQMAMKMNGDLEIDPQYVKGTRFILDIHA